MGFEYWTSFCAEFKDIWEKEVKKLLKNREKELKAKVEQLRNQNLAENGEVNVKTSGKTAHETKKVKEGGLKDRLRAKRLKKEQGQQQQNNLQRNNSNDSKNAI